MPKINSITTFDQTLHIYDHNRQLGHEYHQDILHRMMSKEMLANPANDIIYRQFERLIERLIDTVKHIKLQYAFAYDKNDLNIN